MENENNLDNSDIMPENNEQDLQIEEGINNQLEENESETDELEHPENSDDQEPSAEKRKPTPEEKRNHAFKKISGQKKQLRRENEALKQELNKLRSQSNNIDPMAQHNPNDYTPEQWNKLEIREGVKRELAEQDLERKQSFYNRKEAEIYEEEFNLRKQEFVKVAPDYEKVMDTARDLIIPNDAIDIIQESSHAPRMAYFLAKNRDQAENLNYMTPAKRESYLTKLEMKIELDLESKARVSKAKATPKKGGNGGSAQDLSKMSMEDYAKARRKNSKPRGNR